MKKIIAILLSLVFVFNYGTAFTADPTSTTSTINTTGKTTNNVTVSYRTLTDEQAIQRISQIDHISIKDAAQELSDLRKRSKTNTSAPSGEATLTATGYIIKEADLTYDFGLGRKVEAGVLCEVQDMVGPGKPINSILKQWAGAVESGIYTFTELYNYANINPIYQLNIASRGTVETQIDLSVSGSAEIKQQLIGLGFTVGTTFYLRKTDSWSGSFVF